MGGGDGSNLLSYRQRAVTYYVLLHLLLPAVECKGPPGFYPAGKPCFHPGPLTAMAASILY